MKTRGKKSNTFYLSFIGEAVRIAGDFKIEEEKITISITGFLLDMDDDYYFLGTTPDEISSAIKKESVIFLEVLTVKNQFEEMLDNMDVPEEEEKKN